MSIPTMSYILAILATASMVNASPLPQAVTAAIAPSKPSPPGCTGSRPGVFGIAVANLTTGMPAPAKRHAPYISDGDLQAPSAPAVPRIPGGHSQGPAFTMAPVSMIADGHIQGGMDTMMVLPISQIPDGQVQAPTMATTFRASDGQPQATTAAPPPPQLSRSSNSQLRARTSFSVSQVSDNHAQTSTATAASDISDAQPQTSNASGSGSAASASSKPSVELVACRNEGGGDLELTLKDGILKDGQGRTGYIASNFQFQFDGPPQAGAIYTSGFSICANGTLALGGSNVFYRCLSGDFYNLYDRYWAPQCSPVTLETLSFQDCA